MFIEVAPAYGRDYTNQKAVKLDWDRGLDFRMTDSGQYIGKKEATEAGLSVIVRYAKGLKVMQVQK